MDAVGAENRVWPRHSVNVPVRFCSDLLEFDADLELPNGELTDVSRGGIFIRSDYLEPLGTAVHLEVRLPDGDEPVTLSGRVVWVSEKAPKGPGMGVELDDTTPVEPVLANIIGR